MTSRALLLIPFILLLFVAVPDVHAGCEPYTGGKYLQFSGRWLKGTVTVYSDSGCQTQDSTVDAGDGFVLATEHQDAWEICRSINTRGIYRIAKISGTGIWSCHIDYGGYGNLRRWHVGDVSPYNDLNAAISACRSSYSNPTPVWAERSAPASTTWRCFFQWFAVYDDPDQLVDKPGFDPLRAAQRLAEKEAAEAKARDEQRQSLVDKGIEFNPVKQGEAGPEYKQLGPGGVGIQSVLDQGFIDAIDVWSNVGSGVEICVPGIGHVVFLDASASPRTQQNIPYYHKNGKTCAQVNSAGTLVLVQSGGQPQAQTSSAAASQPADNQPAGDQAANAQAATSDPVNSATDLSDCQVTMLTGLRLRDKPWGRILAVVPPGTSLVAQARTENWIQVTYNGITGWQALWFTQSQGNCG